MDNGDLLGQLSQMLPQVVDKLTPQGQVPQGDLGGLLGGLMGGQRPAGASQAGPGQNSQGGQPGQPGQFNPFRQGRSAEQLGAYIKVLQKK